MAQLIAGYSISTHQTVLIPDGGSTTYFTQGEFEPETAELDAFVARGIAIGRTSLVELVGDAPSLDGVRLADGRFLAIAAVFTAPRTRLSMPLAAMLKCVHENGPTRPYVKID
ncbi:hypothetical protein GGQ80_003386 [Sphingomonas jinjuensis]|uniref:Uncharacterized protein n=1 Tax=Sphingomonas jinjuensis TaxID=535907 RepID=A0A840F8A1_9SPHN|nr:hypothetical protein [Sphingomonas jinjuensis]MBB4155463.1 hypothetical protein [Sphingomonas jinjuensis]